MSFAANIRAALPAGMNLPEPFAQTFDWLEAQGWGGVYTNRDGSDFSNHYLSIYPPEVAASVATLGTIAGDGGTLSLLPDITMPEPEALPIPGDTSDNPFIITRELREALGEEGAQSMRDAFKYVVEEE